MSLISFKSQNTVLNSSNFEELFNEYYTALCRYAIRFVHHPEIAEEIVQDQFIYLWEKRNALTIHTSVKAYLYASVKNKSIDYLRSRFAKVLFVNEELSYEIKTTFDPHSTLEDQELSEIITKAIKALPEKCSIIFSMKRFGELSNKEIAVALNISEKTVENQITIAFKKLRPVLSKCLLFAGTIFLS